MGASIKSLWTTLGVLLASYEDREGEDWWEGQKRHWRGGAFKIVLMVAALVIIRMAIF